MCKANIKQTLCQQEYQRGCHLKDTLFPGAIQHDMCLKGYFQTTFVLYLYTLDGHDTSRHTVACNRGFYPRTTHSGACSLRASPASPCFSIDKFSQIFLLSVPGALLPLVTRSILYTSRRGFKRTETFQTGESLISVVTSRKEVLVIAILLRHVERYFMLRLARHILYRKSPRTRSPSEHYEKRYVLTDNLATQREYT